MSIEEREYREAERSLKSHEQALSSKGALACLLREYGVKLIDIARDLYPDLYREYENALPGEKGRLYNKLLKRVHSIIYYYTRRNKNLDSHLESFTGDMGDPRIKLDLEGGVRDAAEWHAPVQDGTANIVARKARVKPEKRQLVEYEQLLYYIYSYTLSGYDASGVVWATLRGFHKRFFKQFRDRIGNTWFRRGKRRYPDPSLAYVYALFYISLLRLNMLRLLEPVHERILLYARNPRLLKQVFSEIASEMLKELLKS